MRIILSVIFLSVSISQDFPIIGTDNSLDILTWNIETFPKHNETINYLTDIINENGIIEKVFDKVNTKSHANDILDELV